MFRKGPEEKAAQRKLDAAHRDGKPRTQREAERLSDDVWKGRERDRSR